MGAIAGLFHPATPKPVDAARVRAMAAAMAHRGPDGAGEWTAPGVGFAHRRLARRGAADEPQPVATDDLRYALVLDGTILNGEALRRELLELGCVLRSGGDAEILLHGFVRWGPSLLDRVVGAFAFAVHDAATQTLFLARDWLGAKPLHYATLPDGALAFASELKGLLAHPLLRRVPDARAIDDYLAFGHVPDDACMVAGVCKLPAAHFLLVERGRPARPPRRWWTMRFDGGARQEDVLGCLRVAVDATAPVTTAPSALLSEAPDDAAVVALLAEARSRAVGTLSIEANDAAAAVSQRFATMHRIVPGPAADPRAMLDALVAAFDEPFGDVSAPGAIMAARGVAGPGAVLVSGLGLTDLFHGAAPFRGFARRERWRQGAWLRPLLGEGGEDHARAMGALAVDLRRSLFSGAGREAIGDHRPGDRYAAALASNPATPVLDRAHHAALTIVLPARALALADRAGMAASVEWRTPLFDHRLAACATALPAALRGGRVSPLDTALSGHLLVARQNAAPPPAAAWLCAMLAEEVAALRAAPLMTELGWFDHDRIAALVDAQRGGATDHAVALWRLLLLERSLSRLFG